MNRLAEKQNLRKQTLGSFLENKAEMLRNQRIKDGLISEESKPEMQA